MTGSSDVLGDTTNVVVQLRQNLKFVQHSTDALPVKITYIESRHNFKGLMTIILAEYQLNSHNLTTCV